MGEITRRKFVQQTGVGLAGLAGLAGRAAVAADAAGPAGERQAAAPADAGAAAATGPLGIVIGAQTYPQRQMVEAGQFPELLRRLRAAGIGQIELCSPGYREFRSLADGRRTRQLIADAGLRCISSHVTMQEYRTRLPQTLAWAHELGLTQIGTASLGGRMSEGRTTVAAARQAAEEFNGIAAKVKQAGLQLFLHNEVFEQSRLDDGRLTYPVLLEFLDPDLVKMQFQMSGMVAIGDPAMYFRNYPGRYLSAHLHGVNLAAAPPAPPLPLPFRRAATPAPPAPPAIAMGADDVDWRHVFAAAATGGLQNYFIEQEQPVGGWEAMTADIAYLQSLA